MLGLRASYAWAKWLLCLGWFAGCAAGLVACAGFYYVDDVAAQFLKFAYDIIVPQPIKELPFGFHRAETFVEFVKRGWVV